MRSEIETADALQHLCDRGPAAGADRQSGPRRARGGRQSVAHQGPLLRRRRHRRPRLRRDLRAAPAERRALAPGRAGAASRPTRRPRAAVDRVEPPPAPRVPRRRRRREPRRRIRCCRAAANRRPRRGRKPGARVDASEGTPRDPLLKNKTYDLNTSEDSAVAAPCRAQTFACERSSRMHVAANRVRPPCLWSRPFGEVRMAMRA